MTRATNFGRKRTHLEAGFATEPTSTTTDEQPANATDGNQAVARPKKKRKRTREPTTDGDDEQTILEDLGPSGEKRTKAKDGGGKGVATGGHKKRTEQRRLKRMSDRRAETVCFACRNKGHAARDCPEAAGEGGDGRKRVNAAVGRCYKCGSTKHTLSRCKAPNDPLNPLPFASCFVCSRKGHLASTCPQNREKGIYPNGGSCKLCGEKTHLAKDCQLRKKDASGTAATTIFGTGGGAGADEDDFHAFKRKNAQVSRDEKKEDGRRRQLDVMAGLHTGSVRAFGKNQASGKPKKVVFF